MSRMQTITGSATFTGPVTGVLSADDATTMFQALIHTRRRAATELREIDGRLDAFIEERVKHDRRLATKFRSEIDREREASPS